MATMVFIGECFIIGEVGPSAPDTAPKCLCMGHEHEDARHHIQQEIAANGVAAQAQHIKHDIEDQNQKHGLKDVQHQPDNGISVRFSNVADSGVEDQFQQAQRRTAPAFCEHPDETWLLEPLL